MLIELTTEKHDEILKGLLEHQTSDISSRELNTALDACFGLADFIVTLKSEEYLDYYETRRRSAAFVIAALDYLIETGSYEYEIDWIRYAASMGGRLRESLNFVDEFLKREGGLKPRSRLQICLSPPLPSSG